MVTKIYTEPDVYESISAITASGVYNFSDDHGFSHSNTQFTGGSIGLVNNALPGECTFPAWTPNTFTEWYSSSETVTGAADVEYFTDYDSTYRDLPSDMSTISPKGSQLNLKVKLAAGANSLDHLVIVYKTTFASVDDIDQFSYIDTEDGEGTIFTDTQKINAIRYAHARLAFILKDWAKFYSENLDAQTRLLLREGETYYALSILYDRKAKLAVNHNIDTSKFSVGDLMTVPKEGELKGFYANFQAISLMYKSKADEILAMVTPPGTDADRTTFYFGQSQSIKESEE